MALSRVLFAHERPSVRRAVERVLTHAGFETVGVADGAAAKCELEKGSLAGVVLDVGLPGVPGYELTAVAKDRDDPPVVVLVASVYRKTSYKRRPTRLYGADDYVEIHHLCDQLPGKLRHHLGLGQQVAPDADLQRGAEELREDGDQRIDTPTSPERLAALIVSDMILYNGDRILGATDLTLAERAVSDDLEIARDMFAQVIRVEGRGSVDGDPVGDAFREFMANMGRLGHS